MIVGTMRLTGETSKRKRPRGGFAGLCVYVVGKEGRHGMSDRSDPTLARSPVSARRRACRLTRRRRNCAGSREIGMDPGQPLRLRKKNRSSRISVFGVFKFARRAPQSPMPAFAGASAAQRARSRRRLVPTILGGFAGQSRRSPLERSDPTRVLFFPLPVNSTWPDQSSGLRRLETEFRGFCISCRLTPSRPARPPKAPAPPWRVTFFPSP